MKKLLICAAATTLLLGTAMAAPNDDQKERGAKHATDANTHNDKDKADKTQNVDKDVAVERNVNADKDVNVDKNVTSNKDVNVNKDVTVNKDVNVNRNVASGRSRNLDLTVFHRNVVAPRHFRIGIYAAPRGYHYRRWVYGQRLPALYFARNYWLTEFLTFGLLEPPPGLVWVRYGPDALLIDEFTGEIVQVQYGVFI